MMMSVGVWKDLMAEESFIVGVRRRDCRRGYSVIQIIIIA